MGRNWKVVREEEGVLVSVPSPRCPYMTPVAISFIEREDGTKIHVPFHWKHGLVVKDDQGNKIILNRHFYGLEKGDLGQKIISTVRLVLKDCGDGRKYLLIDIFKSEKKPGVTLKKMKISSDSPPGRAVEIPGTNLKIFFQSLCNPEEGKIERGGAK